VAEKDPPMDVQTIFKQGLSRCLGRCRSDTHGQMLPSL